MADDRYIGGGSATVRQGTGARGSGRFTNMSSLLQANLGFDRSLKDKAGALGAEAEAKAGEKEREAQSLSWDPHKTHYAELHKMVGANDQAGLRAGMNQSYSGPRASSIDLNQMQSFSDLKKLSDPRAAGAMLAQPGAQYSGGQRAFDEALFGASTARGDINQQVDALTGRASAADKLFADRVAGFDDQAKTASAGFRDQLVRYHQQLLGNLDERVAAEKKAEADQFKRGKPGGIGNKKAQRSADGFETVLGSSDNILTPSGQLGLANRNNIMSQAEADRFATLASVLGTEALQRDPSYQRAQVIEQFSRDKAVANDQKVLPGYMTKTPTNLERAGAYGERALKQIAAAQASGRNGPASVSMPTPKEAAATDAKVKKMTQSGLTGVQARTQINNTTKALDKKRNTQAGTSRMGI